MPFRNGFLVILRGVLKIQSLKTSTKGNRTGPGLAENVNIKLWTEKAFGSFRGYHRFSTTLNSASRCTSSSFSPLKAQNCGALLHICRLTDLTRKFSLGTSNLWYFARQSSQMVGHPSIRKGTPHSFLERGQPESRYHILFQEKEEIMVSLMWLLFSTNLALKVAF